MITHQAYQAISEQRRANLIQYAHLLSINSQMDQAVQPTGINPVSLPHTTQPTLPPHPAKRQNTALNDVHRPQTKQRLTILNEEIGALSAVQRQNLQENLAACLEDAHITLPQLAIALKIHFHILQEHFNGNSYVTAVAQKIASFFQVPLAQLLQTPSSFYKEKIGELSDVAIHRFTQNLASLLQKSKLTLSHLATALQLPQDILQEHLDGSSYIEEIARRVADYLHVRLEDLFKARQHRPDDSASIAPPSTPLPNTPATPDFYLAVKTLATFTKAPPRMPLEKEISDLAEESEYSSGHEWHPSPKARHDLSRRGEKDVIIEEESAESPSESQQPPPKRTHKKKKPTLSPNATERVPSEDEVMDFVYESEDSSGHEWRPSPKALHNSSEEDHSDSIMEQEESKSLSESQQPPPKRPPKTKKLLPPHPEKVHVEEKRKLSPEDALTFGSNLATLRKHHKLSQETVAQELKCTLSAYALIELGERAKSRLYPAILQFYGLSWKRLLSKTFQKDLQKFPPPNVSLRSSKDLPVGQEADVVVLSKQSQEAEISFPADKLVLFGKNLKTLRKKHHKLSREIVAREIHCKKEILRKIEKGQIQKSSIFAKVQHLFKVSLNDLLSESFAENLEQTPPPAIAISDPEYLKQRTLQEKKPLSKQIGLNVQALREYCDVQPDRFAKVLGCDSKTILRIESGKSVNLELLEKIAKLFKIAANDLEKPEFHERLESNSIPKLNLKTPYKAKRDAYSEGKKYCEVVKKNFACLMGRPGISMKQISKKTKVQASVLHYHLQGVRCSLEVVDKVASFFQITREQFLDPNFEE